MNEKIEIDERDLCEIYYTLVASERLFKKRDEMKNITQQDEMRYSPIANRVQTTREKVRKLLFENET